MSEEGKNSNPIQSNPIQHDLDVIVRVKSHRSKSAMDRQKEEHPPASIIEHQASRREESSIIESSRVREGEEQKRASPMKGMWWMGSTRRFQAESAVQGR